MGNILLPNTYVPKEELTRPLVFLAGPISGAPERQNEAIEILLAQESELVVASPHWEENATDFVKDRLMEGDNSHFEKQRKREDYYLKTAAENGAVLFWLPGEINHKCTKAYGATTRFELGQWMIRRSIDNRINLCVGTDGEFSEVRIIEGYIKDYIPDFVFHKRLEDVCKDALQAIKLNDIR